jgi:hypothetical protein
LAEAVIDYRHNKLLPVASTGCADAVPHGRSDRGAGKGGGEAGMRVLAMDNTHQTCLINACKYALSIFIVKQGELPYIQHSAHHQLLVLPSLIVCELL